jgi:glyoxylase-like metal-dependent hydrolase (beta-lactamase superfamily II)
MQLYIIDAGSFVCDGGGIFGGVPKVLWSKQVKADERNLIRLAMRCLLVVEGDRKVLIETGAGSKLSPKFVENNGIEGSERLFSSLKECGFSPEDITDVVHTHLHWDHCGGGTMLNGENKVVLTFPNATYHCARSQWGNALNPNPREGDAYFEDDLLPVEKSGKLNLIDDECELFPGFEMRIFDGHTPGMIVPVVNVEGKKLAYVTDLVPTVANVPLKWIAAYDLFPVTAMAEKERFSKEALDNHTVFFFEHDMDYECCTIKWDARKGPLADKKGSMAELFPY